MRARPVVGRRLAGLVLAGLLAAGACSTEADDGAVRPPSGPAPEGTTVAFDLDGDWRTAATFYDHPWPSDLRLTAAGTPDWAGFPNPDEVGLLDGLLVAAGEHPGHPVNPVAWFRFDGPVAPPRPPRGAPAVSDPVVLVDLADRRLVPVEVQALAPDPYTPDHVVAVRPRPGHVLVAGHPHAVVVNRSYGDRTGAPLGVPEDLHRLARDEVPERALGAVAAEAFAPLWPVLDELGLPRADVAAATVFTTGDVVADLARIAEGLRDRHDDLTLTQVRVDPVDGADHERFCEVHGEVRFPQFQAGVPPFDRDGLFVAGEDALPVVQRWQRVPVTVTLPRTTPPEAGHPTVVYTHGSGGLSTQVVDRGPVSTPGGPGAVGRGPAHVLAAHGIATVGFALPLGPERFPGATDLTYLTLGNLAAYRDTIRQGALEEAMLLDVLERTSFPSSLATACGLGGGPRRLDVTRVGVMGQSQGSIHANLLGGMDPRPRAVVPTGAGGYWSQFLLVTEQLDLTPVIQGVLGTTVELSPAHPVLHVLQVAWEPVETMSFMARTGARPLPGHAPKDLYVPVGRGDSFYPIELFDALAVAYGVPQAGEVVWPGMQAALAEAGRDGLVSYPVSDNLTAAGGDRWTGAIVQYEGDGIDDPHAIFVQLEAVRRQYGCLFATALDDGPGIIPPPGPLDARC